MCGQNGKKCGQNVEMYTDTYQYKYIFENYQAFRVPIAGMEPYASACKDTREGLKCNTKLIADKYCEESKESLKEDAINIEYDTESWEAE